MSTEELTADERDAYMCNSIHCYPSKLLRFYDAALSRAQAAEQRADDNWSAEKLTREGYDRSLKEAESRLAAATALLKQAYVMLGRWYDDEMLPSSIGDDSLLADTCELMGRLLSATPAQAAEAERGVLRNDQPYAHEGRKRDGKGGYEQD